VTGHERGFVEHRLHLGVQVDWYGDCSTLACFNTKIT
jgi:hypothetical protein